MGVLVVQSVGVVVRRGLAVVVAVVVVARAVLARVLGRVVAVRIVVVRRGAVVMRGRQPGMDGVDVGIVDDAVAVDVRVCADVRPRMVDAREDVIEVGAIDRPALVGVDGEDRIVEVIVGASDREQGHQHEREAFHGELQSKFAGECPPAIFAFGGHGGEGSAGERALTGRIPAPRSPMRVVFLLCLMLFAAACVRVKPHERQDLARRGMSPAGDASEKKLDGHVEEYREGSIGGAGAGGGGCGCN